MDRVYPPKLVVDAYERRRADVAQLAERVLGKDEVTSSILVIGSNLRPRDAGAGYGWRASNQAEVVRRSAEREGGPQRRDRTLEDRRHG